MLLSSERKLCDNGHICEKSWSDCPYCNSNTFHDHVIEVDKDKYNVFFSRYMPIDKSNHHYDSNDYWFSIDEQCVAKHINTNTDCFVMRCTKLHHYDCAYFDMHERISNEIFILNKIKHPNIISLIDCIKINNDEYILVFENYSNMIKLNKMIKNFGSLNLFQSISVIINVLKALSHIHSNGIISAHITPSSIYVLPDLTAILDCCFVFDGTNCDKERCLQYEQLYYNSPEQLDPLQHNGIISHTTDIYSSGILLYEMVCGKPPFIGTFSDICEGTLRKKPVEPITLNHSIPKHINDAIMKALEKNPEDRFSSCYEFLQALERI